MAFLKGATGAIFHPYKWSSELLPNIQDSRSGRSSVRGLFFRFCHHHMTIKKDLALGFCESFEAGKTRNKLVNDM